MGHELEASKKVHEDFESIGAHSEYGRLREVVVGIPDGLTLPPFSKDLPSEFVRWNFSLKLQTRTVHLFFHLRLQLPLEATQADAELDSMQRA